MHPRNIRRTIANGPSALLAVAVVSLASATAPALAQVQTSAQAGCINAMNTAAAKVAKTQFGIAQKCLAAAAFQKLPGGQTAQQCLSADDAGKLSKATTAAADKEAAACVAPLPDFGHTDAATLSAAAGSGALGTFESIFGADLDAAVLDTASNADGARCQAGAAKGLAKVVGAMLGEIRSCKKAGLKDESILSGASLADCLDDVDADSRQKIGKALSKLAGTLGLLCFGTSQAVAFPGDCAGAASLADCVEQVTRCRACEIFEGADALDRSCDLFDDGVPNTSCSGCTDLDGDSYGIGCAAGDDCDDGDPSVHPGAPELCNGVDDDCNGAVDDYPTDAGSTCGTSNVGACSYGTTKCLGGVPTCVGNVEPQMETCNGIDDDCDGAVDLAAGSPPTDSQGSCNAAPAPPMGATSACMAGTLACTGGVVVCQGSTSATATVDMCMVDANCDGALTNQPDFQTDVHNCGGCGNDCYAGAVHSTWTCASGSCQFQGCASGYHDLNADQKCEYACAFTSSQELCNGIDDNCDGNIDEGVIAPSPSQVCGTSPAATTPECTTQVSVACVAGNWSCTFPAGVCTGGCSSDDETCDGLDNDCDGLVNENVPGYGQPCFSDTGLPPPGHGQCQTSGTYVCSGPSSVTCSAVKADCHTLPGGCTEACNGLDDDCNGLIDDGLSGCSYPIESACDFMDNNSNGVVDEYCPRCGNPLHFAQAETCNGQDDNCNGVIDDGGVCGACVPSPEVCDGCDNDCNGVADDGVGAVPCGLASPPNCSGIQPCKPPQAVAPGGCVAGGGYAACSYTPTAETCNGLDDDCDSVADDHISSSSCQPSGNPPGLTYGGTSQCQYGATQCSSGTTVCTGGAGPSAEVCDGIDNNCDGIVDNGIAGLGQPCGSNQAPCSPGVTACVGGAIVCQGGLRPQPEICDGIDNDCDGGVDEAPLADAPLSGQNGCWAIAGSDCSHGSLGWTFPAGATCTGNGALTAPCHHGALVCSGGAWSCQSSSAPVAEFCDGIDNDCNGSADDGGPLCASGLSCQDGLCRP
jgi:hypothetical protein